MGGQYGVKETLDVVDLGLSLLVVGKQALADGKVNFNDVGLILSVFPKVQPAIDNAGQVPKELSELDEQDSAAVISYVKARLPEVTDDAKARLIAEKAFKVGLASAELLSVV